MAHNDDQHYLTKDKVQEFHKELEELRTVRRKEVAEKLEYAKKLGDLSENAEYQEAREDQAEVEDRINHLEALLKTAVVIDERHSDTVAIGSSVQVEKNKGEIQKYKIVGSEEANMHEGKVSNLSPLGKALIGKKPGDSFTVTTPKGTVSYKLVAIE